jgi:hypothetical protein
MHKPLLDHTRFDRWKDILDRFEAGELIDTTAAKMLQDLRDKERKEFENTTVHEGCNGDK